MTNLSKREIADRVLNLAIAMGDISLEMRRYWPDKASEMMGAAEIAQGWANGIYAEIEGES